MAGGAAGGYRGVRAGGDHGGVSVQSAPRPLADDTRHSQGVRTNGSLNEAVCRQGSNIKVQIAELVMFGVPLVSNVTRSRLQSRASRVTHPWHTLACRSTGAPGTPWSDAQIGAPGTGSNAPMGKLPSASYSFRRSTMPTGRRSITSSRRRCGLFERNGYSVPPSDGREVCGAGRRVGPGRPSWLACRRCRGDVTDQR